MNIAQARALNQKQKERSNTFLIWFFLGMVLLERLGRKVSEEKKHHFEEAFSNVSCRLNVD